MRHLFPGFVVVARQNSVQALRQQLTIMKRRHPNLITLCSACHATVHYQRCTAQARMVDESNKQEPASGSKLLTFS